MEARLRVFELLALKRMSLVELAARINLLEEQNEEDHRELTAGNLYSSLIKNPTFDKLARVANALDVEVSELIATSSLVYGYISIEIEENKKVVSFDDLSSFKDSISNIDKFLQENYEGEIRRFNRNNKNRIIDNIKEILTCDKMDDSEFYKILKDICLSINSRKGAGVPDINVYNLKNSLNSNPTLKKLCAVAEAIGVETKYLISLNPLIKIQGIVNIEGVTRTIESIGEFYKIKDIADRYRNRSFNQNALTTILNEVLIANHNNEPLTQNYDYHKGGFGQEDTDLSLGSIINSNNSLCYSFRKNGDYRIKRTEDGEESVLLNFSNMLKYEMTLFGVHFNDSECCYISGAYTNAGLEHERIQGELSRFTKGGYTAKGLYRKQDNDNTRIIRQDFCEYNFEWMKMVVWSKVCSNPIFRDMLLSVPEDAYIIEDTSYHKGKTAQIWGSKNKELTVKRIIKKAQIRHLLLLQGANKKSISIAEQMVDSSINNIGVWRGQNATGKTLMICRQALKNNTIPDIDIDLLNSKNIHWNGNLIEIYIDQQNQYNYRNV